MYNYFFFPLLFKLCFIGGGGLEGGGVVENTFFIIYSDSKSRY